jgi:hypothetical protein
VEVTDDGEVVCTMHRPSSTPQKHYFSASGTHFCQWLSKPQDLVRPEGLGKLQKFVNLIGSRTRDLPACLHKWLQACVRWTVIAHSGHVGAVDLASLEGQKSLRTRLHKGNVSMKKLELWRITRLATFGQSVARNCAS